MARSAERGEHVAVRQRADDFHRFGGGQQFGAAQHGAQLLNALGGPARQVGEGPGLVFRLRGNSPAAGWPAGAWFGTTATYMHR